MIIAYVLKCIGCILWNYREWFGVTYKEDKQAVVAIRKLIEAGTYQKDLYSDLRAV